jgi:hypothetical protein
MTAWLHRAGLAGLLLAAYLWAWTPARTAWTDGSAALLTRAAPTEVDVTARPAAHTIRLSGADASEARYTAPAGIKFLLPGLFLLLIGPARPRLWAFFAGHLGLGALALGLTAAGLAGLPGGLGLAGFVQTYGVDAYSLAVPVFVFARRKRGWNRE